MCEGKCNRADSERTGEQTITGREPAHWGAAMASP